MRLPLIFSAWSCCLPALAALTLALSAPNVGAAQNECGEGGADIVRKAYPSATQTSNEAFEFAGATIKLPKSGDDDPHAMLCRAWPARPELTLVAVPLMTKQSDDDNEGDIELLVVDTAGFEVRQRLRLPGLMTDDALYVSNIAFDTARYHLAPKNTAFGLRLSLHGSSGPNPFGETTLWLFLIKDGQIKPVVDNIVVARNQGEWDTNCAGEFLETVRTLSMKPSESGAFADILVSEKATTTISRVGEGGECLSTETTTTAQHRLPYEASAYRIPEDLKRID